ncbi:sigma-54-dependent Fis family transcriptional regulator [Aromatoleum diolicum]|uniref:GAF domain-containing protein n=1 Tax=Aromatoleum diolicum TaxID=75796 RepID=A0ABX1Q940_9RHOO|nr:GAF domain-containing protein [Aromatoleum diolicum]NMG73541.1 GAF domain-containing protein [Aromatoleum diolicum]
MQSHQPPSLPDTLAASWERSHRHGLRPDERLNDTALARTDLTERLEANNRLLAFSRPMIEGLYRQIGSPSSTVLLADRQGMILSALGHTDFLDRASAVALRPGVDWTEASMGTNAIGTALQTGTVVAVQGDQHYLERNRILACVATPILAPTGGMLGILDVSSDARENLAHAGALLRTTAELIEHRLLETLDEGFVRLHFHTRHDALADPLHALAVFDEGGRLVASNRQARALLKLPGSYPATTYEACFGTPWAAVVNWAAQDHNTPFPLHGIGGQSFIARASLRTRRRRDPGVRTASGSTRREDSRLAAMVLGDPHIARIIDTLHDCATSNTPLLFEGEMGTGKAYLMRAFHADHRASADAPLIGLDCSTLAAGAAGEEELDNAWLQAANGTLFLVEIDALPTALQARLFDANDGTRARVVGTARQPLVELRREGRLDLRNFDASGGHVLSLPPLRERTDFDALVRQFVREASPDRPIYVCPDALALLRRHRWPGNLRELRNQLRLILALIGDEAGQLCPEDIPVELFDDGGDLHR